MGPANQPGSGPERIRMTFVDRFALYPTGPDAPPPFHLLVTNPGQAGAMDELEYSREWLSRRTSHVSDWSLTRLLALKKRSGATVSVVLPALNEQETVGPIVAAIAAQLARPGLVDELVVVDSG